MTEPITPKREAGGRHIYIRYNLHRISESRLHYGHMFSLRFASTFHTGGIVSTQVPSLILMLAAYLAI